MNVLWLILFFFLFIVMLAFFAWKMWDLSFKNHGFIARQSGKDYSDVIWIPSRFKVRNIDGSWHIMFRNIRERTVSVEGKFWTKFINPKKSKKINFSEEEWKKKDLSRLIQRGLFLYETSEGVFFPMTIDSDNKDFKFKIIDQDNRMFLINEIEHTNKLTEDNRRQFLTIIGIIIGLVIIGALIFFGVIYLNKMGTENIAYTAQVCGEYARQVFNVTASGNPTFLSSIPLVPGG